LSNIFFPKRGVYSAIGRVGGVSTQNRKWKKEEGKCKRCDVKRKTKKYSIRKQVLPSYIHRLDDNIQQKQEEKWVNKDLVPLLYFLNFDCCLSYFS